MSNFPPKGWMYERFATDTPEEMERACEDIRAAHPSCVIDARFGEALREDQSNADKISEMTLWMPTIAEVDAAAASTEVPLIGI